VPEPELAEPLTEGARILTICNACRYCEGYCAVFPAMERRSHFSPADLNYLANLCHNCAECYYACQYAPPHPFAVNVPKTLTEIRVASYRQYAWPGPAGAWLGTAAFFAGLVIWTIAERGRGAPSNAADFYAVIPHSIMAGISSVFSIMVLGLIAAGAARFWRESNERFSGLLNASVIPQAARDALSLRYLGGDGHGCTYPDEHRSTSRWLLHHATFYGFLLCFASTTIAAVYHYALGRRAPYPYFSLPVVLGTVGGIGLLIGPAGLWRLKQRQDSAMRVREQNQMDRPFIALLFLTSASGLALLALRETAAMRWLLALHLAIVLAFFVTLPYGKFVHAIYRAAALLRYALERSREEKST